MTTPDRFADQWASTDKVGDAVKKLGSDAGALYEPGILSLLQKDILFFGSDFARLITNQYEMLVSKKFVNHK